MVALPHHIQEGMQQIMDALHLWAEMQELSQLSLFFLLEVFLVTGQQLA